MLSILGKHFDCSIYVALIFFFLSEVIVYNLYPVENINREVDADEDRQFKKRLKQFLVIDGTMAIIFSVLGWSNYLHIITITIVMIAITMAIGKCKKK